MQHNKPNTNILYRKITTCNDMHDFSDLLPSCLWSGKLRNQECSSLHISYQHPLTSSPEVSDWLVQHTQLNRV